MNKYFLQNTILGTFDLIDASTGKTVKNNVNVDDYEFIKGTNYVTNKNNKDGE